MKRAAASIAASVLGLSFLGIAVIATPAQAAGTAAGTVITPGASISFQVNTVSQSASATAPSVTVDRVVNLTVSEVGADTTSVFPGKTRAAVAFTMTNTSNAKLDFLPSVVQPAGGVAAHGGTDNFDVTNGGFFDDTNGNGAYDSVGDAAVTFFDEVPADTSRTFFYVADIPTGLAKNSVAGITLTVTAREGGVTGTQGAALAQATGANTAGMDTVFADGAGATDAARDGAFSARDDYTVLMAATVANLSAARSSMLVSDPVNGAANPKAIPGATVEYCIAVTNSVGSAAAQELTFTEALGPNLTFDNNFGVYANGTVTGGVCDTSGAGGGTPSGSFAAGTVSGTIASLAEGETKTIRFRAIVK